MIDQEKEHNSFKAKNSAHEKILLVMLKFHFQPGGGQISLFQPSQWLLTVPKVVLGKVRRHSANWNQSYNFAILLYSKHISYSKACIIFIFLHLFALKVQLQLSCAILTWQRTLGDLSLLACHINNDKWSSHPNKMKINTLFAWALDYCYGAHETSLPDQHFVLAWSNWIEKASSFVVIRIIFVLIKISRFLGYGWWNINKMHFTAI